MEWVDSFRKIGVFTNADTPADAAVARKNGAQGIGLVRTGALGWRAALRGGAAGALRGWAPGLATLAACLANSHLALHST